MGKTSICDGGCKCASAPSAACGLTETTHQRQAPAERGIGWQRHWVYRSGRSMSLKAYQWKPWEPRSAYPDVKYGVAGPYVEDGQRRIPVKPLCWIVVSDDGHVDVKPSSWKGDE